MRKEKQAREAKYAALKRLYGVKPETFEKMKNILVFRVALVGFFRFTFLF
ncbi:MAG: hypothetical protein LBG73_08055 [Spirochaetaceae bacterium]|nr:hypothetical protein [Spirochaetaceae bacterium]